jgi:hypothetical protein
MEFLLPKTCGKTFEQWSRDIFKIRRMDKRMKMIGKIFIACGLAGFILLFGFLLNRVDSLQQSVNYLNNNVFDLATKMSNVEVQQRIVNKQQENISMLTNKLDSRCPWQSALHNPNLVNKYWVSVDIIEKNASTELAGTYEGYYVDVQGGKWTHIYNETKYNFPNDAIIYLKTLEPLSENSTYLINILNNSTDSRVSEYQQSVFEYPQDAINYLEFINFCGQTEKDWERSK